MQGHYREEDDCKKHLETNNTRTQELIIKPDQKEI